MSTEIPYRHVESLWRDRPARLPLVEIRDTASTTCTDTAQGDRDGTVCLCHWAPWFDGYGRPDDGLDPDYEPMPAGDPFADIPAAEPWRPRCLVGA